jgi:hypothetical protein
MPELPLAHHVVQALPFFAPVLVIAAGLTAMTVRERWRDRRGHG